MHQVLFLAVLSLSLVGAGGQKPETSQSPTSRPLNSDCESIQKKICTMEYRPFRCSAKLSDQPAIEVRGGNPCEARNRLDYELCTKGFNEKNRQELEKDKKLVINCSPQ